MNELYKVEIVVDTAPPAGGSFSESIFPGRNNADGFANISITGDFDATVTLQRSVDDEQTWNDVDVFKQPQEIDLIEHRRNTAYRIGVKESEYNSGSVSAVIIRD